MNRTKIVRKPEKLRIVVTIPMPWKPGWPMMGWERISPAGIHKSKVPQYWDNGKTRLPIACSG